jgi:hypothetical protein
MSVEQEAYGDNTAKQTLPQKNQTKILKNKKTKQKKEEEIIKRLHTT